MIKLAEYKKCTGCMACAESCPSQCIYLEEDILGNIYPKIDSEKCIECGKCQSVCPELNIKKIKQNQILKVYAMWSNNKETRYRSASGGAASEFYDQAIKEGYWICGAEYSENFKVIHTLSKEKDSIKRYQQSKYVYSYINDVYKKIKILLEHNQRVLFISLPCKVSGLLFYLGKKYNNLLTVDIVCHGTPSYKQLKEHIDSVDINHKATKLLFRSENQFKFMMQTDLGECISNKEELQDTYLAAFLSGLNYRYSCYDCFYAKKERIADITICDFWGLGKEVPFSHPYEGSVSAVLINSEEGKNFFEKCKLNFFCEERPIEEAVKGNAQLNFPTPENKKRKEFEKLYSQKGFEYAVKKTLNSEIKNDKRLLIQRKFKSVIKKMIIMVIPKYRR